MEQLCEEKIAELRAALVVLLDGLGEIDTIKVVQPFLHRHKLVAVHYSNLMDTGHTNITLQTKFAELQSVLGINRLAIEDICMSASVVYNKHILE